MAGGDVLLDVRLLGPISVVVDERPVPPSALAGRHGRLVLAHLAASERPVHREELAETLWGDRPPSTWLRTLSSVVSRLRTGLSETASAGLTVSYDDGFYAFAPSAGVRVDVVAVRDAAAETREAARRGDWDRVARVTGSWMSALQQPMAPEIDTAWADRWRQELAQISIEMAVLASTAATSQGRHSDAVATAREAVQRSPLSERAHRALMAALAGAGDRAGALAAYAVCREVIADELGVDPDLETQALYLDLLREDRDTSPARPRGKPVEVTFLLTDVEASTRLWGRFPDLMPDVIVQHERVIEQAVVGCGGRLLKARGEGDSTFSVFTDPLAALRAAIAVNTAIAETPWPGGIQFSVRIAVHTGIAEEHGADFMGFDVSRAARLRSLANGGQILVSGATATAVHVPADLRLTDLGRVLLADVGDVDVHQLEPAGAPHRPLPLRLGGARPAFPADLSAQLQTPLFGREAELSWLWVGWQRASGGPISVTVAGEEGVGKTRLAAQFAHQLYQAGAAVMLVSSSRSGDLLADVLTAVGQVIKTVPLLVVADGGVDAVVPLQEVLSARLAPTMLLVCGQRPPRDAGQVLTLHGVDADAAESLLEWCSGILHSADVAEVVVHETAGNPRAVIRRGHELARSATAALALEASSARGALLELQDQLAATVARSTASATQQRALSDEPPYRGLLRFEPEDASVFFGREQLIAEMAAHLLTSRFLAVIGSSGSGKSSLVRAGLVPTLRARAGSTTSTCRVVVIVPGRHPLTALGTALGLGVVREPVQPADLLSQLVASLGRDERVVVVVDQFEEVFTSCDDEAERAATVELLLTLAATEAADVCVVVTMRSDFYGRCAAFPHLASRLRGDQVLVGAMSEAELRRAVEAPARAAGVQLEEGLVDQIVADVATRSGALPLMSTALLETWRLREGRTMTLSGYDVSGGVSGALARLAESVYDRFSQAEKQTARTVMMRLAATGAERDLRRRVPREELLASDDDPAARVLAALVRRRLVIAHEDSFEVAHEALFREWPRLREWLAEDADGQRLLGQLAEAANEWERRQDSSELFRGGKLLAVQEWLATTKHALNARERAFVAASQAAEQHAADVVRRANRRLRLLAAGLTVVLVGAVLGAFAAIRSSHRASQAATLATAQRLATAATGSGAADLRLLLAVEARRLSPSAATNGALLAALNDVSRVRRFLDDPQPITTIAVSQDGSTVATGDRGGTVRLWSAEAGTPLGGQLHSSAPVTALAFSPDGTQLAAGDAHGLIRTWKTATLTPAAAPFTAHSGSVRQLRYTQGGAQLQSFGADHLLRGFDAGSGAAVATTSLPSDAAVTLPAAGGDAVEITGRTVSAVTASGATRTLEALRAPASVVTAGASEVLIGQPGGVSVLPTTPFGHGTVRLRAPAALSTATPTAIAVAADGHTALVAYDSSVVRYDLRSGTSQGDPSSVSGAGTITTLLTRDASTGVAVSSDGKATVLDLTTSALSTRVAVAAHGVRAIAVAPSGRLVAVGDELGNIDVLDTGTGSPRLHLRSAGTALGSLAFSPDGRLLAAGDGNAQIDGANSGSVSVWRTTDGHLLARDRTPGLSIVSSVAFLDDRDLALVTVNGSAWRWVHLQQFAGLGLSRPGAPAGAVVGGPDGGQEVFLVQRDGTVLEEGASGPVRVMVRAPASATATQLAVARSGKAVVVATDDLPAIVTASRAAYLVNDPLGPVQQAALSPDGSTAAFVSDGSVLLWDVAARTALGTALAVSDVTSVAFTPDGRGLLLGTADGGLEQWRVTSQAWVSTACRLAARRLTPDEWRTYLPGRRYQPVC